jgi:hypothetical protein
MRFALVLSVFVSGAAAPAMAADGQQSPISLYPNVSQDTDDVMLANSA